ncbi:MAG: hypothetical protein AAB513_00445 [Patescibacteria group bacterium]
MSKLKNIKLLPLVFVGLIFGILGVSKTGILNESSLSNKEKIALSLNNNENMCYFENEDKNVSLFVSCAGFLE